MFENKLFSNNQIDIYEERKHIFVDVKAANLNLGDVNQVIEGVPRIKVTDFISLKNALENHQMNQMIKIGELKPLVEVSVSKDGLEATAVVNMTEEEFAAADKKAILAEVLKGSNDRSIVYGQDINEVIKNLKPKVPFVIAVGKAPIDGEDAVITMYELEEAAPELYQDGKVNHYELNLINTVNEGAWLGERIEPKPGVDGIAVNGQKVPARNGRQEQLKYDPKTVRLSFDEEKQMTLLHAKRAGAVVYMKDRISVSNYLDIQGDVSFHTGNIDFDGFVDISNTVDDNFSVQADDNIQVLGDMGVGGVELIESRNGDIYIRGGIAGKNKAVIRCSGNLYTKFAADCTIECDGVVNIGYYAMNCNIKAKEVILEADNSQIIGGTVEAFARVLVSEVGSRANVYTKVVVRGFDREHLKRDYDLLDSAIENARHKMDKAKEELKLFGIDLTPDQRVEQETKEAEYNHFKDMVEDLLKRKKIYISYLHAKGEGEIVIKRKLYPNVSLNIKDDKFVSTEEHNLPVTFYYEDFELKQD